MRLLILVCGALASLGSADDDGESCVSSWVDSRVFTLTADDTNAGHFALFTRHARQHWVHLGLRPTVTYDGPESIQMRWSLTADRSPNPVLPDRSFEFRLAPLPESYEVEIEGNSVERECLDQCMDGFSFQIERLSDVPQGVVTVQWQAYASAEYYDRMPLDMEFEVVDDSLEGGGQ